MVKDRPTLADTARAIRTMQVRGAAAIGIAAARALADHVQGLDGSPSHVLAKARAAARRLDAARPTAVTLHNALGWVLAGVVGAATAAAQRRAAREAANLVAAEAKASRAAIAKQGARLVPDGGLVLTHCNSSTVVSVLAEARRQGRTVQAIATETRPFRQGLLTLRGLHEAGIGAALVVDSAVEHVLSTRDVDLVLVGADAVAADGSLFNKIGTAGVAALASLHEVPFHSAVGLHKFTRRGPDDIPIEHRAAAEVAKPAELPPGVEVLNPVFDRTPPQHIASFITEQGLAAPRMAVRRNLSRLPPEEVWG